MVLGAIFNVEEVIYRHKTFVFLNIHVLVDLLLLRLFLLLQLDKGAIVPFSTLAVVDVLDHLPGPMQLLILVHCTTDGLKRTFSCLFHDGVLVICDADGLAGFGLYRPFIFMCK
jgi:hypothetical protein